jgi:NADH-quinone oxidoreductase subunit M
MSVLVFLILIPLIGSIVARLMPKKHKRLLWGTAVTATGVPFGFAFIYGLGLSPTALAQAQGAATGVDWPWVEVVGMRLSFALDGLSFPLVAGSSLVFFAVSLCCFNRPVVAQKKLVAGLLLAESGCLTALIARDLGLFVWGWLLAWLAVILTGAALARSEKTIAAVRRAAIHLGAATALVLGGVIVLAAAARMRTGEWSFALNGMTDLATEGGFLVWAFVLLFLGLGSGAALFPLHTWLPEISDESPTPVAAVLAATVTKAPLLMLARLLIGVFPGAATDYAWVLAVVAVVGVGHSGLLAWTHRHDLRKMQADLTSGFHSVALIGFLSLDIRSVSGAVFLLTAHALGTCALYLAVGGLERSVVVGKRPVDQATQRPALLLFGSALLGTATLVAVPGFAGFVGELLIWLGAFDSYAVYSAAVARFGAAPLLFPHAKLWVLIALLAALLLPAALAAAFYKAFVQEPLEERTYRRITLSSPHLWGLALCVAASLVFGVWPNLLLNRVEPSAKKVIARGRAVFVQRRAPHRRPAPTRRSETDSPRRGDSENSGGKQ